MKAWKLGLAACAAGAVGTWAWADDIKSGRMTAQQVATVFKTTNQALSEGISAAEKHIGGKAVDAECFGAGEGQADKGNNAICMVTVLTSDNKLVQAKVNPTGQILGQNNVDMAAGFTSTQLAAFNKNNLSIMDCIKSAERHVNGKAVQVEALKLDAPNNQAASCMVTVLTNDNKLVQASVTQSGQVVGQQNVDSITLGSGFAVSPGLSSERTTMAPTTGSRTGTTDNTNTTTTSRVITTADRGQAGGTQTAQPGTTTTTTRTPGSAETASADDFAMPKRFQKASDLMGKNVTNTANENLGEIKDIVLDAGSGRILYGVLSFGGVLGLGDKYFAIPWQSIRLAPDYKAFVLHIDKDRLKDAQGFDKNQWPNFADDRWATTTYKTFNQTPYWDNPNRAPTMGSDTGTQGNFRDRWYQKVTNWQKASDLIGKDTHNPKNEDIGKIKDIVVDPDSGRVLYAVLGFRGKNFPVPFNAMNLTGDGKKVILNIDKEALKDTIAFTDDKWPNMVDPTWSTQVHTVYNVQPYWVTGTNPNRPNDRP